MEMGLRSERGGTGPSLVAVESSLWLCAGESLQGERSSEQEPSEEAPAV